MRLTEEQYAVLLKKRIQLTAIAKKMLTDVVTGKPSLPKRPKYGNQRVTDAQGLTHDSRKEYRRWCDLQLRERAGEISQLHRQPVFDLIVNGLLVCRYIGDASYVENATGARVCEDTKSQITRKNRVYLLKKRLMKACHGIDILET